MSYRQPNVDFKSGGDATATAEGYQANVDLTQLSNAGFTVGVANPNIQSDDDITGQSQNVGAGAFGGHGGTDNVSQNINV